MNNIVTITKHSQAKRFNVGLLSPNTGRERDGYAAVGKAFRVGIRAAKKEAARIADLYSATIDDQSK
jgi:outer membrane PBP1 activator LpoA protein|tara:strand:+ start:5260 stop:5460 length:201 start_codon:yes stop_codon:yes gene_type:complete